MLRCNAQPYEGSRPYVFISYSHKEEDKAIVYPILERMEQAEFRLWYDQGIESSSEWDVVVAEHLKKASAALFCISKNFSDSTNCKDELAFAKKHNIESRITLFLESDSELEPSLDLALVRQQQIFLENYNSTAELVNELKKDANLQPCLGATSPAQKPMKLNITRIRRELQDETFLAAQRAYKACDIQKAMELYRKAYASGNGIAGTLLAAMYYNGRYCTKDYDRAVQIFIDCIHRDNPIAAAWLAYCYLYGRGVPKDKEKACALFAGYQDALEEMAILGSRDAQYLLGSDLFYGDFTTSTPERGVYWLQKAAAAGSDMAKYHLAKAKLRGTGCPKDVDAAIREFNLCKNNPTCAYLIAGLLQKGTDGIKKNEKTAFELLLYAAKKGHIQAQRDLGDCYYDGQGTSVDYGQAIFWYQKAADKGDLYSIGHLGMQYLLAKGVSKDIEKAISFFTMADEKNGGYGARMLGYIYCGLYDREKSYKDPPKAVRCLQRGTDRGDEYAMEKLLQCFHGDFGKEVQDLSQYYKTLQRAADLGNVQSMFDLGCALIDGSAEPVLAKNPDKGNTLIDQAVQHDHYGALLMQAKRAFTATPPQKELGLSALEKAEKVHKSDKNYWSQPLDTLCKFGDLHFSIGLPGYSIENLTDTLINSESFLETLPDLQNHCLCLSFFSFEVVLKEDKTSLHALIRMSFLQFLLNEKSDFGDDAFLLDWLKKEAPNDWRIPVLLGAYYEKNHQEEEMIYWLKLAAKKNISSAYRLGRYCLKNRTHGADALEVLEPLKKFEDGTTYDLSGCLYRYGIGTKKDRYRAKYRLRKAAELGSKEAAAELRTFWF